MNLFHTLEKIESKLSSFRFLKIFVNEEKQVLSLSLVIVKSYLDCNYFLLSFDCINRGSHY